MADAMACGVWCLPCMAARTAACVTAAVLTCSAVDFLVVSFALIGFFVAAFAVLFSADFCRVTAFVAAFFALVLVVAFLAAAFAPPTIETLTTPNDANRFE